MTSLSLLQEAAAFQMVGFPQYDGHEQKYVLAKAKKTIKTKGGLVAEIHSLILAEPEIRTFIDMDGKKRSVVVVWSFLRQAAVEVNSKDIWFLDCEPKVIHEVTFWEKRLGGEIKK